MFYSRLGSSPTNSDATTAVVSTLRRNNNNVNLTQNNNRQNTFNRTLEMSRNNANPMGIASQGTLPGTLTLGRIKADRNNYQNGYVRFVKKCFVFIGK